MTGVRQPNTLRVHRLLANHWPAPLDCHQMAQALGLPLRAVRAAVAENKRQQCIRPMTRPDRGRGFVYTVDA